MLHKINNATVFAALLLSTVLIMTVATTFQLVNAQSNLGGSLFGNLTNVRDQIVKGGNNVAHQISKGGVGLLPAFGAAAHLNAAYRDTVKADYAGARTELKKLYANFLNDSETVDGLSQELSQIAQNNSVNIDSHTKQLLSAVGVDLREIALGSGNYNSTTNGTGVK